MHGDVAVCLELWQPHHLEQHVRETACLAAAAIAVLVPFLTSRARVCLVVINAAKIDVHRYILLAAVSLFCLVQITLQGEYLSIGFHLCHHVAASKGFRHKILIGSTQHKEYESQNGTLAATVLTTDDIHTPMKFLIISTLVLIRDYDETT